MGITPCYQWNFMEKRGMAGTERGKMDLPVYRQKDVISAVLFRRYRHPQTRTSYTFGTCAMISTLLSCRTRSGIQEGCKVLNSGPFRRCEVRQKNVGTYRCSGSWIITEITLSRKRRPSGIDPQLAGAVVCLLYH